MSRQLARSFLSSFYQHSKSRHSRSSACYIQTIVHVQHRHLSSTTDNDDNNNKNNDSSNNVSSDKTKEWIPPSRPLSGDKGQSHLYLQKAQQLDDEIDKLLDTSETDDKDDNDDNGDVDVENGQFIDLDDLDLEELQKRMESGEFEMINGESGDSMEDLDIEQLIREIQQMESNPEEEDGEGSNSNSNSGNTEKKEEEDYTEEKQEVWIEDEDKFQKHYETQDFLDEPELHVHVPVKEEGATPTPAAGAPDWLSTRRAKLATSHGTFTGMMTPSELRNQKSQTTTIPIVKHTLLSSSEIMSSLINDGAKDVKIIVPDEDIKSYLGWDGLILATASSYTHIRVLTDALVHNLRKRGLAERGVIGAKFGAEGGEDPTMSSYARRKRRIGRGKNLDDGWMSVDCRNYIVHVQDDVTRRSVDLEGLWSPGSKEGRLLRRIDPKDEDAVDEWVASNPIPEEYADSMKITGEFFGTDGGRGGYARSSKSKKDIVSGRYTPTNNQKRKVKNRGRFG